MFQMTQLFSRPTIAFLFGAYVGRTKHDEINILIITTSKFLWNTFIRHQLTVYYAPREETMALPPAFKILPGQIYKDLLYKRIYLFNKWI